MFDFWPLMKFQRLLLLGLAVVGLASCNHGARPSGFLGEDDARLRANKKLPFQRSWINPEADFSRYRTVAVIPMRTDRLKRLEAGLDAASFRNFGATHRNDCEDLAKYGTLEFRKKIHESRTKSAFIIRP
jgi:hypothetical protein